MTLVKTMELQKAYDAWSQHIKPLGQPYEIFWKFIKVDQVGADSYDITTDLWKLSPESVALVNLLLSPHRTTLLKIKQIRESHE